MPFAYTQDVPIGTDAYARIRENLGTEPLAGQILHLVIRKEDGMLRYIDVWESEEACDRAFAERIHSAVGAVLRERGITVSGEPPRIPLDIVEVVANRSSALTER